MRGKKYFSIDDCGVIVAAVIIFVAWHNIMSGIFLRRRIKIPIESVQFKLFG